MRRARFALLVSTLCVACPGPARPPVNELPAVGTPAPVATGLADPLEVIADAEQVWVATSAGVLRLPVGGGAPVTVAPQGRHLALDGTHVYWVDDDNRVTRAAKGGGEPQVLARGDAAIDGLAVDATRVYYVQGETMEDPGVLRMVAKEPAAPPEPITILPELGAPRSLRVDDQFVYWVDFGFGTVTKIARDDANAEPVDLAEDQVGPEWLALGDGRVFFSVADGGLRSVAKDGGAITAVVEQGEGIGGVAAFGDTAWFTTGDRLVKAEPGQAPVELASGQAGAAGVAIVPGRGVVWANAMGGQVMGLVK